MLVFRMDCFTWPHEHLPTAHSIRRLIPQLLRSSLVNNRSSKSRTRLRFMVLTPDAEDGTRMVSIVRVRTLSAFQAPTMILKRTYKWWASTTTLSLSRSQAVCSCRRKAWWLLTSIQRSGSALAIRACHCSMSLTSLPQLPIKTSSAALRTMLIKQNFPKELSG